MTGCPVSLVEILRERAARQPDRDAYLFLADGEEARTSLSYGELGRRTALLAAALDRRGLRQERALLLFPPGLDFVIAFLACLRAGVVAVPAYPPRLSRSLPRLRAIARDARPLVVLTTAPIAARREDVSEAVPELGGIEWLAVDALPEGGDPDWSGPEPRPEALAFLQYTSGSTSDPRGVRVSHGNLVHNEAMIERAFGQSAESVIVGWLPLYHDMGLIGNVLQPLYVGASCILMAPAAFLQQPARWLRAIHRYRATTSGGPNFAYELCVQKIGPEERRGLDLSSWTVAYNGAEPVRAETLDRFAEAFAPCGFRREAFYPCYGLAEATLFVSGGAPGALPRVTAVDAAGLERNRAEPAREDAPARRLVSCGRAAEDQRVAVVEPETGRPCAEGEVGEVWIAGPSVAGGYWGRPEETARTFGAHLPGAPETGFLRTGDLGFVADGDLFLTGRIKDLIILRGRNLYPQDVERTVERSHEAMRAGCGAAFSVDVDGEERLVVVQEVERDAERRWARHPEERAAAVEALRRAVAEEHEAALHAVALLRAGSVPKTSSGKVRRQACRADFLEGRLEPVGGWREGEEGDGAGAAPRTPTEERLERIWAEVLGRERVGIDRGLFELGGDSLRAMQLLSRIRESFGVDLPFDALFAAPTIAELAGVLDGAGASAAAPPLRPVAGDRGALPLSSSQRRLWFLHQLDPDNPVHNIAAAVRARGRLDPAALLSALAGIVERHEALRTGFSIAGGEPVQAVAAPGAAALRMPAVDLSGLPAPVREAAARRLGTAVAREPFDLDRAPLLRAVFLRLGEEESELVLAFHHIAADGWSLGVLLRELGAFFTGAPLPPLPVQYGDFAVWQRERMRRGGLEAELAFWRERLAGELPVVELPADRPRPAFLSHRGAHLEKTLPARVTEGLAALAREAGATLFMALLAGFKGLLERYTGLDDLALGTPVAGRNRVETEGLIGVFTNNVVLRTSLAGDPDLRELLGRVRATAVAAYAHQELPFERLVDELYPRRDLSRMPLFQILFVGQNAPLRRFELPGAVCEPREIDPGTARFDLVLSVGEGEEGWTGTWKYSTDLFDAPTMARLAGHFEALLARAVAAPGVPLSRLSLLSEAERHQVVVDWNDTRTAYAGPGGLYERAAARAALHPDAVAVEMGSEQLTYAELFRRARFLAWRLRGLGVGPESRVGIAAERSFDLMVGVLGILEAGAAYVPLDFGHPADRLAAMLEDSAVAALLVQGSLEAALPPLPAALREGGRVLPLETEPGEAGAPVPSGADPDSPAYVLFTSGSTGRPKGVAVSHRSIVNQMLWRQEVYGLTPEDRILQKTPLSFDVSVWELFWPLLAGARLVMAPPGAHRDPVRLAEVIERHGITTLHFVPSMLQVFLEQEGLSRRCARVRRVFVGGEALPSELAERFRERLPGIELHNLYGPTEAAVDVTFHRLSRDGRRRAVPIGRPLANTSIVLLDRHLAPVPPGVPGELYIGGVQLARGYLGRPDLTAERFVPAPVGGEPGERMYRTGDLARFRPDGAVEYLGRLDHQVKIRGVRIELGEIEAALARHPGVREATVLARRSAAGPLRLVAYAVAAAGAAPEPGELRAFLQGALPEAMIPAAFVLLPALPLTTSGKVDRKALPEPGPERPEGAASEEPATPLERSLAGIWRDLLGVGRVGRGDDFFALGGDSMQAAMLANRLQKELGRTVYVRTLFESPTLAGFAAALEAGAPEAAGRLAGAAGPDAESGVPLSFAQERLWFLDRFEPGGSTYNLAGAARFRGTLDEAALARCLGEIVRRHAPLRTVFEEVDGRPRQRVLPASCGVDLPVIDLAGLPEEARGREALRLAGEEAAAGFDLSRPALRARLLRLDPAERQLLLTLHHIVADGWSLGLVIREISALYEPLRAGAPSPLPELPVEYADFAAWQRQRLSGEALAAPLAWWRERLAGAPAALELPTDRPRPAVQTYRGGRRSLAVPAGLADRLRALGRENGATLFMTLLAAFEVQLSRLAGQDDLTVGVPVAGRGRAELEDLIGMFVDVTVYRASLAGSPDFVELLRRVREMALGAWEHQDVPFEVLLAELRPERSLSRTPLFQVFFNMLNFPGHRFDLPGLSVEVLPPRDLPSKLDLTLYVDETDGGLGLELVYNAGLFDGARAEELLRQYRALLARIAADPRRPVAAVSLLTPEAEAVLPDPRAELDGTWHGAVHEIFAARARRHPERLAVKDGEGEWTYGELHERSNRLAHRLRGAGVGPGGVVAVWGHRSAPLVWAVMGILKSGAAFTLLDPAYPAARLADTLRLARPAAWIGIAAAGPPPGAVEELLADGSCRCRVTLGRDPGAGGALAGCSGEDPGVRVGPDDLACVAFTSGSTGVPKGILCRQGPLSHFVPWQARELGLGEDDRFSALSGLAHDPLQRDLFTPLQLGAAVCLPDPERIGAPGWLAGWMARERITVTHLTPALGQLLADSADASTLLPDWRLALLVGDVLTRRDVARLRRFAPGLAVINLYGSTETQRAVAWHRAAGGDVPEDGGEEGLQVLPLGRGMPGVQLLVETPAGALAGIGELGEICVRSPHLARGYLGDPERTRERFPVNPHTGREGDRIYRTGDLGRYLPDGEVVFVARADQQVKVRGFRIELGEIEAVLGGHPGVREAVVVARGDGTDRRLAAYVVPAGRPLTAGELRERVRGRLPDFMVPADFVLLAELPLTPNGKVDRRALPDPEPAARSRSGEPRGPLEELLAGLWAEVLGREAVGAGDDFFALGGHSLMVTRLVSRLREATGVELPLRALFEAPTVARLAREIERARRAGRGLAAPPVRPVPRGGELPATFSQQRLWVLDRLEPGNPSWNLAGAVRLDGPLRPELLERSLAEVVRRHEALRTVFAEGEEGPVQIVRPPAPLGLPRIDLAALPGAAREAELRRLAAAEADRPFDLSRGPLARLLLVRLGAAEHVLLSVLHHIAGDAWSLEILVGEVAALYRGGAPLPELAVQPADFAAWQRSWLSGEVLERHLRYWTGQLQGALPRLDLAEGRPGPEGAGARAAVHAASLPRELSRRVREMAGRQQASLFMTLFAAFSVVLHAATGRDDLVVGTDVAQRNRSETEGLIGFFVNQLPLRVRLAGSLSFRELLAEVRETTLGAYDHQDLPFDRIVEALRLEGDRGSAPLFRVKLNLKNVPRSAPELPGLTLTPLRLVDPPAQLDLIVNVAEAGETLSFSWEHRAGRLETADVERMARQLEMVLEEAVARPDVTVAELRETLRSRQREWRVREERALEEANLERFKIRRRAARVG